MGIERTIRSRVEAVLGEAETSTGGAGSEGEAGTGGASDAGNGDQRDSGSVELPPGTPCELLYGESSGLDCYDEGTCVPDCKTEPVAPLREGCSDVPLKAYAACLLGEDEPTVCTDGNLIPNLEVCLERRGFTPGGERLCSQAARPAASVFVRLRPHERDAVRRGCPIVAVEAQHNVGARRFLEPLQLFGKDDVAAHPAFALATGRRDPDQPLHDGSVGLLEAPSA